MLQGLELRLFRCKQWIPSRLQGAGEHDEMLEGQECQEPKGIEVMGRNTAECEQQRGYEQPSESDAREYGRISWST